MPSETWIEARRIILAGLVASSFSHWEKVACEAGRMRVGGRRTIRARSPSPFRARTAC